MAGIINFNFHPPEAGENNKQKAMSKPSKAIFRAISDGEQVVYNNPHDAQIFLEIHKDKRLVVNIQVEEEMGQKNLLYAYYQAAVIPAAIIGLTNAGWEAVDAVYADHVLKANSAKDFKVHVETGEMTPYLLDKSTMSKERLTKFVSDSILFIETTLGVLVPDSQEYLEKRSQLKRWK
jgi:hypothetical protein